MAEWFIVENPMNMDDYDDLRVPPFQETSKMVNRFCMVLGYVFLIQFSGVTPFFLWQKHLSSPWLRSTRAQLGGCMVSGSKIIHPFPDSHQPAALGEITYKL
jgi:hypothetical protein